MFVAGLLMIVPTSCVSAPLPFAYCMRPGEEERDVLSAGPATHFRHRPKFNLNAAGFVSMRRVALTLRRVAQMLF
jgi:hypothetical protein